MHEQIQTYLIPNNFIDENRVFNGAIRVRYLVEAIVILVAIAGPCWLLIPPDLPAKWGITLGCSLPLTMLALVGINGDSLSDFLKSAFAWKNDRQIMLYNENVRTYQARPVDVMLSENNASDILMNSLEKWKNQRSQQNANMDLVENVDFVFMEDKEYERMTPQEIRQKQKREAKEARKAKKEKKKAKRNKKEVNETKLLPEKTSVSVEAKEEKQKEQLFDSVTKDSRENNQQQPQPISLKKEEAPEKAIPQNDSQPVSLQKTSEQKSDEITLFNEPETLPTEKDTETFVFEDEEFSMESEPETFAFTEEESFVFEEDEGLVFEEDESPAEELIIPEDKSEPDKLQQTHAARRRTRKRKRK